MIGCREIRGLSWHEEANNFSHWFVFPATEQISLFNIIFLDYFYLPATFKSDFRPKRKRKEILQKWLTLKVSLRHHEFMTLRSWVLNFQYVTVWRYYDVPIFSCNWGQTVIINTYDSEVSSFLKKPIEFEISKWNAHEGH